MADIVPYAKQMLITPSKIALSMLTSLEDMLDGNQTIPNAMNGLCILWAAQCGVSAGIVNMLDAKYAELYPKRALTPEQLYPHLSQYDYVNLQSEPATLLMNFAIRKDEILAYAVDVDDTYAQIVIPKTSFLAIGPISVSWYHDIVIRVNKNTQTMSVLYDTTEDSPFETLDSNMMENKPVEYRENMLDYLAFGFKTYQFTRTTSIKTVSSQQGFSFVFPFTNNYFASRIFSIGAGGVLTEIQQSFSKKYYDTSTATAIITLDNVNNQVTITIPQIYLETNLVSSQIKIEIYSTMGAINYNIPAGDALNVMASFDSKSSVYSAPLSKLSSYKLYPLQSTMVGGSSPKTFSQMKNGVINQSFYDRIPITEAELKAKAQNSGYELTEVVDDITNRIFYASNSIEDYDGTLLPVLAGSILLADDALTGNPSTILKFTDQTIVVLPTTIFELGATGSVCTPVSDEKIAYLNSLTKENLVAEMNTTTYLRQPFHIALTTSAVYPSARPYNLLSPKTSALTYVKENENSDDQMTVTDVQIRHLDDGTGGYQILLAALLTDSMIGIDTSTLRVALTFPTATNTRAYVLGEVISVTTDNNVVFSVQLDTTYHIDGEDNITINLTDWNGNDTSALIPLSSEVYILLLKPNSVTNPTADDATILANVPDVLRDYVALAMQSVTMTLGTNLEKSIYSAVNTTWGNDVFKTYLEPEYRTATDTVFQRDTLGKIVVRPITNTDGSLSLDYVAIYNQGDVIVSELDIQVTTTSITLENQNQLQVDDTTGILKGMMATCAGLGYGVLVTDVGDKTLTLSGYTTDSIPQGTAVIFSNKKIVTTTSADQGTDQTLLSVPSTTGIYVGQSVYGFDIPQGTVVADVPSTTSVKLSNATTAVVKSGADVTFLNKTAYGDIVHQVGDIVRDVTGNPIIVKDRQNQYRIPAILFDGRIYASQNVSDEQMVANIPTLLADYAAGITDINFGFAEQRDVFYQPSRTIGTADFDTGDGVMKNVGLEKGINVIYYLPQSLYGNDSVQEAIKKTTVAQFSQILEDQIISMFTLAKNLRDALGDQITGVSVSGLDNDDDLLVCSLTETGCKPSVRKVLYVRDDGVIDRMPDISYEWKSSPDGS